ncbi:unnamed protein product [Dovyalis caffra]|uniref:Uncharacterized protein n=1 Tax=Dovyalis caffra TaxID=77055 RepID=A0AAV1SBN1_9ROSI|nr:unnamed protein product [Dovyalis caffra]
MLDNENPVKELVVVPEEAAILVVADGKPVKGNPVEPVETAAAPVPAVVPEVALNAGKLSPEVALLVLVEVTAVAPLAGVAAVVVVTVENNGDTVVDFAEEEEAALPNKEGCEGADDCVPNEEEAGVEGADVDAIAAAVVGGAEAGVVFGIENPVEKLGAELALEKEDEGPNKLVVVLVVEAVDGDDPNREGAELVVDRELPNKEEPELDADEGVPNKEGVEEVPVPNRGEAEAVVVEEVDPNKVEDELAPNRGEAEVVVEEVELNNGEGEIVPNRGEEEVAEEEVEPNKGEDALVPNKAEPVPVPNTDEGEGEGADVDDEVFVPNREEVVFDVDEEPEPKKGLGEMEADEAVGNENREEVGAEEEGKTKEGLVVEGAELGFVEEVVTEEDPNENPVVGVVDTNGDGEESVEKGEDCVEEEAEEEEEKPDIKSSQSHRHMAEKRSIACK